MPAPPILVRDGGAERRPIGLMGTKPAPSRTEAVWDGLCERPMPIVGMLQPIMADRREVDAHLSMLRTLCDQADALRKVAEELCERLTKQMEETRTRLVHTPPPVERRRKSRNKTR